MKDVVRVPRALGPMSRVVENVKQPMRKKDIETRDLSQPKGLDRGWPDAPRARKIVLPVCMDTKHDQALYALLSQRPDTRQHAMMGISACWRSISRLRYVNADRQLLVGLLFTDADEGERGSVVGRASLGSELWLGSWVGFIVSQRIDTEHEDEERKRRI